MTRSRSSVRSRYCLCSRCSRPRCRRSSGAFSGGGGDADRGVRSAAAAARAGRRGGSGRRRLRRWTCPPRARAEVDRLRQLAGTPARSVARRRIVAMGGGGFSMEPENPLLDRFVLSLARSERPRVCFLPTASGDSRPHVADFYRAFAGARVPPGGPAAVRAHRRRPARLRARAGRDLRRRQHLGQPARGLARARPRPHPRRGVGGRDRAVRRQRRHAFRFASSVTARSTSPGSRRSTTAWASPGQRVPALRREPQRRSRTGGWSRAASWATAGPPTAAPRWC